jgi:hypothetical protein
MRHWITLTLFAVAVAAALADAAGAVDTGRPSGSEALRRVDQALFPDSCIIEIALTDFRPKTRGRTFNIEVKTARGAGSVLAILSPATETGKTYLFKDRSIWMALPGLSNLIRVSAKEGFMDSNFSNSDLMDTEYSDDYSVSVERDATGRRWILKCTARTPQVTYGSIKMTVDSETYVPESFEYFTRSGLVLKSCVFSEKKLMAGRIRATRFEMRDSTVANTYSVITIQTMSARAFPASVFTVGAIRK